MLALQAGTVFDSATGLHWLRDAGYGEFPKTWQEAHEFIAWMNRREVEGHSDWRLPNINELETLVDCSRRCPALAVTGNVFERPGTVYWSSTTSMYQPDWAWALYLDKGAVGVGHKAQVAFTVWAVRID